MAETWQPEIPKVDLRRMMVHVEGTKPLITNRFSPEVAEQIEADQTGKAKKKKEPRQPEVEFQRALHPVEDGVYGFPASGIKKALVRAGGRFADEKMTELRGVIRVEGELIPIEGPAPVMRRDPVNLGRVWSLAYRPMFEDWSMTIPIRYYANHISPEQVLNIVQLTGEMLGIGSWRPENDGPYGTFKVVFAEVES